MSPAGFNRLFALWLLSVGHASGTLLRLPVTRRIVKWKKVVTDTITVPILADGQNLNLMMDTGTDQTFLISAQPICDDEPCDVSVYGFYYSKLELGDRDAIGIVFEDKTSADIIYHEGTLELGGEEIPGLDFGIAKRYSTFGLPPHASLGLAPRPKDGNYTPLLDQLVEKGVISEIEFSIYFEPQNMDKGELIIGGKDTMRYQEPLAQVPLTAGANTWWVGLKGVEEAGQMSSMSRSILIDSGANSLFASFKVIGPILKVIDAKLKAAGRRLVFNWSPSASHELQDCSDRVHLPSINLVLQGQSHADVRVIIPSELYVLESRGGRKCSIMIKESRGPTAVGLTLLRHYYLHYQLEKRQIGIALTKAHFCEQSADRK